MAVGAIKDLQIYQYEDCKATAKAHPRIFSPITLHA